VLTRDALCSPLPLSASLFPLPLSLSPSSLQREASGDDLTAPLDDSCFKDVFMSGEIAIAIIRYTQSNPHIGQLLMRESQFEASCIDYLLQAFYLHQHAQSRNKRFGWWLAASIAITVTPFLVHQIKMLARR